MKKETADMVLSRLSVDVDVKEAIMNIKALKQELDELKKYFKK